MVSSSSSSAALLLHMPQSRAGAEEGDGAAAAGVESLSTSRIGAPSLAPRTATTATAAAIGVDDANTPLRAQATTLPQTSSTGTSLSIGFDHAPGDDDALPFSSSTKTDLASAAATAVGATITGPLAKAEVAAFMLGTMGSLTGLTLWPVFFILHSTGVEPFVLPAAEKVRGLAISVSIDTLYAISLLFGIQITRCVRASPCTPRAQTARGGEGGEWGCFAWKSPRRPRTLPDAAPTLCSAALSQKRCECGSPPSAPPSIAPNGDVNVALRTINCQTSRSIERVCRLVGFRCLPPRPLCLPRPSSSSFRSSASHDACSPLWISVGSVMVVPASILADWLLHHTSVGYQGAAGILIIILSFAVLNTRFADDLALRFCGGCCRRKGTRLQPRVGSRGLQSIPAPPPPDPPSNSR